MFFYGVFSAVKSFTTEVTEKAQRTQSYCSQNEIPMPTAAVNPEKLKSVNVCSCIDPWRRRISPSIFPTLPNRYEASAFRKKGLKTLQVKTPAASAMSLVFL